MGFWHYTTHYNELFNKNKTEVIYKKNKDIFKNDKNTIKMEIGADSLVVIAPTYSDPSSNPI